MVWVSMDLRKPIRLIIIRIVITEGGLGELLRELYYIKGGITLKVQLNPTFDKISGKLNRIVFFAMKKELVDDNIVASQTYARALSPKSGIQSIVQDNIVLAFQLVVNKFNALKLDAAAYLTWTSEAEAMSILYKRTVTAYQMFMSYYMTKYASTLGVYVKPTDLSAGTSLNFADRASRIWS